jgi:flavin-dependent dehydrogenase
MFDRALAERALRAGATSYLGTQAQGAERENGGVRLHLLRDSAPFDITCRLLVGADGVRSGVAKWFKILKPRTILPGFEMDMVGVRGDPGTVKLFLGSKFAPGFFGWIIPAGDTSRVGLCVGEGNAWGYLQEMLRWGPVSQYTAGAQPLLYIAGGIPLGFPRRTYADNVLVVGDAACQAKATSGGGIFTALLCATLAAETAVGALESGDCSRKFLRRYHRAWTRSIGKELRKDLAIHETYRSLTDSQMESVFALLDNPVLLDLISRKGDIDFPSKVGWAILREEPRLLRFAGRALAAMIRKELPFLSGS